MFYPSLNDIKKRDLQDYQRIPVCKEILSDFTTPIEVMRILKSISEDCFLLESVDDTKRWSRYSYIGYHPKLKITCRDGCLKINQESRQVQHPHHFLKDFMKRYKSPVLDGLPTFTGGLVGYFGYDYYQYNEPNIYNQQKKKEFDDLDVMLFDKIICFDNDQQKMILIHNIELDELDRNYQIAIDELNYLSDLIRHGKKKPILPLRMTGDIQHLFSKEEFCQNVEKAKHYIKEGDIFQVVLSNCLSMSAKGSLFDTYRILRTTNPSPYMFYFSNHQLEIVGSSPETLVKIEKNQIYTYPLAGTRPRGKDEQEDDQFEKELLQDQKELSEHNMLVDLGRNDIGKVCEFGSVQVEKYLEILKFSHVMHIGSTIKGQLQSQYDAIDAIDAVLPAGTLSGAPKIRACQIIDELEKDSRGIYGGAIGYIDFTGQLDMCIAIRFACKKNERVYVRSGAGIVYDSEPKKEYQECLNKAMAIIDALKRTKGGFENDSFDR